MCCTIEANTVLSETTVYAARVKHPKSGEDVHVMGYQNSVRGSVPGPNAMILPIPSATLLGPENLVDARPFKGIIKSYRQAVVDMKPKFRRSFDMTKGSLMLGASAAGSYQVFQSGSYTVASADSAAALGKAIKEVPDRVRPNIPIKFLIALNKMYPGWSFLACCFSGYDVQEQDLDPVVLWYKAIPERNNRLFAPAVDAHDGEPPNLGASVTRDHTLAFGLSAAEEFREAPGIKRAKASLPEEFRWMFTTAIVGSVVGGSGRGEARATANGDFILPVTRVMDGTQPGYMGADEVPVEVPIR